MAREFEHYKAAPGPARVETLTLDWHDQRRNRPVPAKIYFPAAGESLPIIAFSHGTGGSRAGYGYLGRHWASHGYVSVHVQHVGSDAAVWQGKPQAMQLMRAAATSVENSIERPRDLSFAISEMEQMQRGKIGGEKGDRSNLPVGPKGASHKLDLSPFSLAGRLDLQRVAAAGHSFGAYTALAVAGQMYIAPSGERFSFVDSRVKAAVVMSPSAPRQRDQLGAIYAHIAIPVLHMTGTRDESPLGLTAVGDRRLAFDHIGAADQLLVIFRDGDHMVFSDHRRLVPPGGHVALIQELVRMITTAFWDCYLRGEEEAKRWLRDVLPAAAGEGGPLYFLVRNSSMEGGLRPEC